MEITVSEVMGRSVDLKAAAFRVVVLEREVGLAFSVHRVAHK
jgi:hypothetical protein